MKIILSGGGTGGSVTPLISIYQAIKKIDSEAEFIWVSPYNDPVKELIARLDIKVINIFSGKLRRYFSWRNFIDPIFIFLGFIQSRSIIKKFQPDWLISAGSFVSVPLVKSAGKRTKVLIHQQDVIPGLANKLMAQKATVITVALQRSVKDFDTNKTRLVGNPVRPEIFAANRQAAIKLFDLNESFKTVLFVGGGTGAANLNKIIFESVPELIKFCQIIHLTGGKIKETYNHPNYKQFDFLTDQLKDALAVADLVISRAGMGFLTELAALKKPTLIVPMPNSHQEANAQEFYKNNAAAVISQKGLTSEKLILSIKSLLRDQVQLENYSRNMAKVLKTDAAEVIAKIIYERYQP
jgi:UDP-N-acetylglucosamine--N-acetylmuramyl-(pentapeptide) pyrophosphoryl-undecaprenol N-acetylglucosamine transferase